MILCCRQVSIKEYQFSTSSDLSVAVVRFTHRSSQLIRLFHAQAQEEGQTTSPFHALPQEQGAEALSCTLCPRSVVPPATEGGENSPPLLALAPDTNLDTSPFHAPFHAAAPDTCGIKRHNRIRANDWPRPKETI